MCVCGNVRLWKYAWKCAYMEKCVCGNIMCVEMGVCGNMSGNVRVWKYAWKYPWKCACVCVRVLKCVWKCHALQRLPLGDCFTETDAKD